MTRFEKLDFVRNLLFPLLKNSKSVVEEQGHCLRSRSPLTFFPCAVAETTCILQITFAKMIEFLIDNVFVQFGGHLFLHAVGIPVETNGAPLLADFFFAHTRTNVWTI